jgi:hypothetical protein
MGSKMTLRDKLDKLLNQTVAELTDDLQRKMRDAYEVCRSVREDCERITATLKAKHVADLESAEVAYYTALSQVVNNGLLAMRLTAPPMNTVLELVSFAHAAIPSSERKLYGVPMVLPAPTATEPVHLDSAQATNICTVTPEPADTAHIDVHAEIGFNSDRIIPAVAFSDATTVNVGAEDKLR